MPIELNDNWIFERLTFLVPLVLSLSVHEWAHAWAAWRLGDDTARLSGRLTLNPLAHIDPIGTLLLPLLGIPFGWAKPVPINPLGFTRRVSLRTGVMLVSLAGPLSNLVLALGGIVWLACLIRFRPDLIGRPGSVFFLLYRFVGMNVVLAAFNMLPVPPLDGSRVADALMPRNLRGLWEEFYRSGPIALVAVIVLPRMLGVNLFAWPLAGISWLLGRLVDLLA